ncbi:hypothetical protein FQA39_LY06730 [Lamprigera yunnana]|nr:hypothetical protein FQA39_LY06730 [Lamprigera yunnana]
MSEVHNLEILDPESGLQYNLLLSTENFVRSQEDQHFLSSLLFHAKANRMAENAESLCNTSINEDQNLKTNYAWKYNQVVEFIKSMSSDMEDLNHPKKRKQVFEHVVIDRVEKFKLQTINKCFLKSGFGECDKVNKFAYEGDLLLFVCFKNTEDDADLSSYAHIDQSVETESPDLTVMDCVHEF